MESEGTPTGDVEDRPSTKPVLVVAGLLMLTALGAAVTTTYETAPAPHHRSPAAVVVTEVQRASAGGLRVPNGASWS